MSICIFKQESICQTDDNMAHSSESSSALRCIPSFNHHSADSDDCDDGNDSDSDINIDSIPAENIPSYSVTKTPGLSNTTIHLLKQDFECVDFMHTLKEFLLHSNETWTILLAAESINSNT
ncbi:hypothetical protein A0H81_09586 [Grifola frondosa]|uniref:Uncharacterized protein n=1 Tax=Grifola frondosa TaxID=5627 RepID=A0A1C7LZD4_GRIFR|nr:hypothetical protein A0H81_09586 [Grifola frondosa]